MGRDVIEAVAIAVQVGQPVLVWGNPGEGKTQMIQQVAGQLERPCEVVIGSIREPVDFSGLPVRTDSGVSFAPPRWAQRCVEEPMTVVFLDELTTAPPSVQAAMLRVVLDREVGDLTLPSSVSIVAAANPPDVAAGGDDLASPLANRFCHLDWEAELNDWLGGMMRGWFPHASPIVPDDFSTELGHWRASLVGFIRARPSLLRQFPADLIDQGRAWPSPRSWDIAHRLGAAASAAGANRRVIERLVAGSVGAGPAEEFLRYERDVDLPDPELLLADPAAAVLPDKPDLALAVLAAITSAVAEDLTEERWMAAWELLAGLCEQGRTDLAAMAANELLPLRQDGWPAPRAVRAFLPVLRRAGLL